jgi:hypothetical protein
MAKGSAGTNPSKISTGDITVAVEQADSNIHAPQTRKRKSLRGAAKRSATLARALEQKVWNLVSKGKTPTAIALEIGIARQSVHRIIRRVEQQYRDLTLATVDEMKSRQARRLEHVADEAMAAWERSKQPLQRVRRTTGKARGRTSMDSGNHADWTETQVQLRVGDVRYLTQAREALADLRKLYGIGVPYENFGQTSEMGFDDPGMPR